MIAFGILNFVGESPLLSLLRLEIHPHIKSVTVVPGNNCHNGPTIVVIGPPLTPQEDSELWTIINDSGLVSAKVVYTEYKVQRGKGESEGVIAHYRQYIQDVVDIKFGTGLVGVDVGMSIEDMIKYFIGKREWGIGLALRLLNTQDIGCIDKFRRHALQIVQGQILHDTSHWVADRIYWLQAGNIHRKRRGAGGFVFSS